MDVRRWGVPSLLKTLTDSKVSFKTFTDSKVLSGSMLALSISTTPAVCPDRCVAQSHVTATCCEHEQIPHSSMTTLARQ